MNKALSKFSDEKQLQFYWHLNDANDADEFERRILNVIGKLGFSDFSYGLTSARMGVNGNIEKVSRPSTMIKYPQSIFIAIFFLATIILSPKGFTDLIAEAPIQTVSKHDIESTATPIIQRLMKENDIPGVAVIVVQGGKVVFKKGYGYADYENQTPVDPDTSIFHIGSVTKLFTATAVMQLYEQRKLDLDISVNTYLKDFHVEEPFDKSITMANLLTHTGGLHYKLLGTVTPFGEVSTPLAEHLAENLPGSARPPGVISVYSNYGIALAGHVVEEISGQSYQDYIDQHILQPLGMSHSGLILTRERSLLMAMPGASDPDNFPPADFNYSNFAPATEIHSSAGDIAKFMLMQLGHDSSHHPILKPETLALMQQRQYTPHSSAFGFGYAFREALYRYGGHHAIGHSGSWFKHLGRLTLFPQHDLGIYIVMNKRHVAIFEETTQAIVRLYGPPKDLIKPTGNEKPTSEPLSQFAGTYIRAQFTTPTIERLILLTKPNAFVDVGVDGSSLVVNGEHYYETDPGFFLREDGMKNIVFTRDPNTAVHYLSFNGGNGFQQISLFEQRFTQGMLLLLAFICLITGILIQRRGKAHSINNQLFKLNLSITVLATIFVPVVIGIVLSGEQLGLHILTPWWVAILLKTPWLIVVLALFSVGKALINHANISRTPEWLIVTGIAIYFAILFNWNLV